MTCAGTEDACWTAATGLAGALREQVRSGNWEQAAELEFELAAYLRALLAEQPLAADSVGASVRLEQLQRVADVYADALDQLVVARAAAARELAGARTAHRSLGAYLSVAGSA